MNKTVGSTFESWIFDSYPVTAEGLGLYRIFCAFFILLFSLPAFGGYTFLSNLPADFFSPPPGPMMFFKEFPPAYVFLAIHSLLIIVLVSLALGYSTKLSSLMAGILVLVLKGFAYSLGKINHDILLAVVPLVMAFSGWGNAYSIDSRRTGGKDLISGSWAVTLLALIIGFMFFTAGFPKILGGWLNIHAHAALGYYLKEYFIIGRTDFLAPFGVYLQPAVWKCIDYLTVIFEVGFLAAVVHPKSMRLFISLAVLFHFGIMLLLNITFWPNILAYAAFLRWDLVNRFLRKKFVRPGISQKKIRYLPVGIVVLLMIFIFLLSRCLKSFHLLSSDMRMAGIVILCCSVPFALYYLGQSVKEGIR